MVCETFRLDCSGNGAEWSISCIRSSSDGGVTAARRWGYAAGWCRIAAVMVMEYKGYLFKPRLHYMIHARRWTRQGTVYRMQSSVVCREVRVVVTSPAAYGAEAESDPWIWGLDGMEARLWLAGRNNTSTTTVHFALAISSSSHTFHHLIPSYDSPDLTSTSIPSSHLLYILVNGSSDRSDL
jgi:hypothetical protein